MLSVSAPAVQLEVIAFFQHVRSIGVGVLDAATLSTLYHTCLFLQVFMNIWLLLTMLSMQLPIFISLSLKMRSDATNGVAHDGASMNKSTKMRKTIVKIFSNVRNIIFSKHLRVQDMVKKLVWRLILVLCAITGIWYPVFSAVQLLEIATIFPGLKTITKALTQALPKVVSTFLLVFVFVFIFAKIGFYHLYELWFDGGCDTFMKCFGSTLEMAFMGVGSFAGWHRFAPNVDESKWLEMNVIFSSLFVIVVEVIIMNIVFGTIIDTFSAIRAQNLEVVLKRKNICFMCRFSRNVFDKEVQPGAFDYHMSFRTGTHNILSVVRFIFYIRQKHKNELDGLENYVLKCLDDKAGNCSWFPIGSQLSIKNLRKVYKTIKNVDL